MSHAVVLIGSKSVPREHHEIDEIIKWHLEHDHRAVWSDTQPEWMAGGMRVVAKMVGAKVLALTGTIAGKDPKEEPIEVEGRILRWRYDVDWDPRPSAWVPAEDVGEPFDETIRTMRTISREAWLRAYRTLHGHDPPRQDAAPPEWMNRVGRGRG